MICPICVQFSFISGAEREKEVLYGGWEGTAHIQQMKLHDTCTFQLAVKKEKKKRRESCETPLNFSTFPFLGERSVFTSKLLLTVWSSRGNSLQECFKSLLPRGSAPAELTSWPKDHKAPIEQAAHFWALPYYPHGRWDKHTSCTASASFAASSWLWSNLYFTSLSLPNTHMHTSAPQEDLSHFWP